MPRAPEETSDERAGTVPESPKESADDLSSVGDEDDSQPVPGDQAPAPSVGDAFRGGS